MKIKFVSNYHSTIQLTDRLIRQFLPVVPNFKHELVIGRNYDKLIIFNRTDYYDPYRSKNIVFIQEPNWSPVFNDHNHSKYVDVIYSPDPSVYRNNTGYIYHPSMMYYHLHNNITELLTMKKHKRKKLSIVAGKTYYHDGHVKRTRFVEQMLESNIDFDLYGYGWTINDNRYKGSPVNKIDGLLTYEFSIAIENSNINGYVTEKFTDCLLTETIPIYYGAPNIETIYNKNGFITINIESENIIEIIHKILETEKYSSYYDSLIENKMKFLTDYNILDWCNKNI